MKSAVVLSSITALAAAQVMPAPPPGQNANIGINPNSNRNFDPATNTGAISRYTVSTAPTAQATGGPSKIDAASAQAMQAAIRNWMTDTTLVSQFLNDGKSTSQQDEIQFKKIADGAFKAEVDELTNKQVLDMVIGLDPRVSIANQTLQNGCFQQVVDNLQIMSFQGSGKANLIDTINAARCTQVLPSIDTYMFVATEYIQNSGFSGFQARSARPDACAGVLAMNANDPTQNPPVPGSVTGTPMGLGDGNVPGLPGLNTTQGGQGNLGIFQQSNLANGTTGNAGSGADAALPNQTTQQLGLPGFPNQGAGGSPNGQSMNGNTIGSTPPGLTSGGTITNGQTSGTSSGSSSNSGSSNTNPNQSSGNSGSGNTNPNQGAGNTNPNQGATSNAAATNSNEGYEGQKATKKGKSRSRVVRYRV